MNWEDKHESNNGGSNEDSWFKPESSDYTPTNRDDLEKAYQESRKKAKKIHDFLNHQPTDDMETNTTTTTIKERQVEQKKHIIAYNRSKRKIYDEVITEGEFVKIFSDLFDNISRDESEDTVIYKVW